jgi:membrane protease YdiL (CAAX protease family)
MTISEETDKATQTREAIFALIYFAIYLGYLCVNPETEWLHWITLVGIPLLLLAWYHIKIRRLTFKYTLESCGIKKSNLKNGIGWAVLIGLAISVLQLVISRQADELLELISSGKVVLLLPLTFVLLLMTAGFTEEFFFRGVMLTRLHGWMGSQFWSVVISAIIFGLYHFPYAYLNPNWPSYGNFAEALMTALGEGIPGGLLLGFVYIRTKNNLVASVLVHTMINWLPAMTMLKF